MLLCTRYLVVNRRYLQQYRRKENISIPALSNNNQQCDLKVAGSSMRRNSRAVCRNLTDLYPKIMPLDRSEVRSECHLLFQIDFLQHYCGGLNLLYYKGNYKRGCHGLTFAVWSRFLNSDCYMKNKETINAIRSKLIFKFSTSKEQTFD